jgi:hypothetical protein
MLDLYVVVVASSAKFDLKQLLFYSSNCCNSDRQQTGVPMLSQDQITVRSCFKEVAVVSVYQRPGE